MSFAENRSRSMNNHNKKLFIYSVMMLVAFLCLLRPIKLLAQNLCPDPNTDELSGILTAVSYAENSGGITIEPENTDDATKENLAKVDAHMARLESQIANEIRKRDMLESSTYGTFANIDGLRTAWMVRQSNIIISLKKQSLRDMKEIRKKIENGELPQTKREVVRDITSLRQLAGLEVKNAGTTAIKDGVPSEREGIDDEQAMAEVAKSKIRETILNNIFPQQTVGKRTDVNKLREDRAKKILRAEQFIESVNLEAVTVQELLEQLPEKDRIFSLRPSSTIPMTF